ncbi:MAG: hypothetical protein LBR36_09540 [Bacteroidales bacterium]|jgi:hypothetical protein|nr:hypothetical protein [Bacteroidales bacterium]
MAYITLKYNPSNDAAKKALDLMLSSGYFEIEDKSLSHCAPEFVEKILQGTQDIKEGKGKAIKIDDLWK